MNTIKETITPPLPPQKPIEVIGIKEKAKRYNFLMNVININELAGTPRASYQDIISEAFKLHMELGEY